MIEIDNVYNIDCRYGMRQMIEQGIKVDCIITDPPYLIEYKTDYRADKSHRFCKQIIGDNDENLIKDIIPLLARLLRNNGALYMFCGSDKIDFFKTEIEKYFSVKNIIVWDKGNTTAGDLDAQYGKQYEFIIYAGIGRPCFQPNIKRYSDIWTFPRIVGNSQIHQNQKPTDVISRMLRNHTKEGDIILDPFMGSFTTAVACHKLKRHYIGFELDEEYYKLGTERLEIAKSQISIFDLEEL